MIRKLGPSKYRIFSKSKRGGKRRNLGTFRSKAAAEKHEQEIRFFKHRR